MTARISIRPYHALKRNPSELKFHARSEQIHSTTKKLYLGFELETEMADENAFAEDVLRKAFKGLRKWDEYVSLEHDGSLTNGVEIVSQPFTFEWLISQAETKFYYKMFERINRSGQFRSHDTSTCGLHVHVSRNWFTEGEEVKFGFFLYQQKRLVHALAHRQYNRYALGKEPTACTKEQVVDDYDRYFAVNYTNRNTIEVRIFKGTLNWNTFMATLEFVTAVAHFAKVAKMSILASQPTALLHFQAYIAGKSRYKHLQEWMMAHGYEFNNLPRFNLVRS